MATLPVATCCSEFVCMLTRCKYRGMHVMLYWFFAMSSPIACDAECTERDRALV